MPRRRISRWGAPAAFLLLLAAASAGVAGAATLRVGSGRPYATVAAAARDVADGDTVRIAPGRYAGDVTAWRASDLTIVGDGPGRAHLDAAGRDADGKGIWVFYGKNYTVENVEFSGASVRDQNGAGIRGSDIGTLVVRNCSFHDNEDGMLVGADSILVENSEFDRNGFGDGQSHNLYVWGRTFTLRFCTSRRSVIGHDVKTRARTNYILYNRIVDEADGTASYQIDVPEGGRTYVIGNVIEQGPNTDNSAIIAYGAENAKGDTLDLYVIHNTIVNDRREGGTFLQLRKGTTATVRNNIFYGPGTLWTRGARVAHGGNYVDPRDDNGPKFRDPATYDYRLTTASPASIVNAGIPSGVSRTGYALTPTMEWSSGDRGVARPTAGAPDVGAFELAP